MLLLIDKVALWDPYKRMIWFYSTIGAFYGSIVHDYGSHADVVDASLPFRKSHLPSSNKEWKSKRSQSVSGVSMWSMIGKGETSFPFRSRV